MNDKEATSAWRYLISPVMFMLLLATVLWGSAIERVEWKRMKDEPVRTYLALTGLQVVRILVAWAAWAWLGSLGLVIAVTLGLRTVVTGFDWFMKWVAE